MVSTMRKIKLHGTTDAGGDLTVESDNHVHGLLHAVEWIDGDLADGVDAVLSYTSSDEGVARTLLTLTDANVDDEYYPRAAVHDDAGAGVTYDGTNEIYDKPLVNGKLKLVISSGGNAKSGGAVVHVLTG